MKRVFQFIKKRWYVFLILVFIVGYFIYQQQTALAQKEKEKLYAVKRVDLEDALSLSGGVKADEHVVLRFQTSGMLSWVGVKEGDRVKKYQGIASLDQRELKKTLQKSLNSFAKERNAFDQSKDDTQRIGDQPIREAGDRLKRALEDAQYDLNSSILNVELNTISMQYANLWSPIDGIVIRADAKYAGVNITPASAEFEIVNPDTLYFSFVADQTEIIKLKEGTIGEIEFDAYPEEKVTGPIYYIAYTPKQGETGVVYEGRIRMPETSKDKYRYGMTGDINFVLNRKDQVIAIPSNYVKTDKKGTYVKKWINKKPVKTYIKIGQEVEDYYEVLGGIKEGDFIYISNSS